jgi:hypothetical protein
MGGAGAIIGQPRDHLGEHPFQILALWRGQDCEQVTQDVRASDEDVIDECAPAIGERERHSATVLSGLPAHPAASHAAINQARGCRLGATDDARDLVDRCSRPRLEMHKGTGLGLVDRPFATRMTRKDLAQTVDGRQRDHSQQLSITRTHASASYA